MTSSSTLIERLRRAASTAEPERDVAVVLSEFIDDGGLDPVDNPFHPAQREPISALTATLASNQHITVTLIRSADGVFGPPQRHCVPVVIAVLSGSVSVEVFTEVEDDVTEPSHTEAHGEPRHHVEGSRPDPRGEVEIATAQSDVTHSEHGSTSPEESLPDPCPSELLSAGSAEVAPDEVAVVHGDVIHRSTFVPGVDGLALHVAIGNLAAAVRHRWIDGTVYAVTGTAEYPLSGNV